MISNMESANPAHTSQVRRVAAGLALTVATAISGPVYDALPDPSPSVDDVVKGLSDLISRAPDIDESAG